MIGICLTLIDTEQEKQKFIDLYEKYKKLMFYIANDILKNSHLAEEAVQEAFLRIAKNFHKIDGVSCPQTKAFAVIVTRNTAINVFNKEHKIQEIHSLELTEGSGNEEELFDTISHILLAECILKLPEMYRDVLYLKHIYGYRFNEIAGLLSITADTAKKRAQRARALLKKMLDGEGHENER